MINRRATTRRVVVLMLLACAGVAVLAACAAADDLKGKLLLLAAASTRDAVDQVRTDFTALHPGVTIRVSYGASSTLAQQIAAGAEADLFLSASTQWADFLSDKKLLERRRNLLGNRLVIVVPADSKLEIREPRDLLQAGIRHLALADPKSVPAGVYARQALLKLELWSDLESKVAGAADVRQALHLVETSAAEAGIVYATDALDNKKVRVVLTIDPALTEPIHYPLALVKRGADNPAAVALYEYLASPPAAVVFRRFGFIVLDAPPGKK